MDFGSLVQWAADLRASDIFLKANRSPAIRLNGRVTDTDFPPIPEEELRSFIQERLPSWKQEDFLRHHEADLAFDLPGICRLRANFYQQQGTWAACFRLIPFQIYSLEQLNLPPILKQMALQPQGLVLVTGPTGCGKSTTLAAMIELINQTRKCNIITIEDPIEYVYEEKQAIISQREVGIDTDSFTSALKHIVRQSPDVILIGEMRDLETMTVALQASEMGHLVFSTVHTISAPETVERIISLFPLHEREQVLARLAVSLRGIISQKLIPKADGSGRIPACEILVSTPTVVKHIQEGRARDLHQVMAQDTYYGMQTLNASLVHLVRQGLITEEDALSASYAPTELRQMLRH